MGKYEKYVKHLPKLYNPQINPVVRALLQAWATGDDEIVKQLDNTKAQIFVRTAEGRYLNKLGSGLGVSRPNELGLLDADFQTLIPNLSLKPKLIRKAFYDTMDVFWGPLFSRINITSTAVEPFNVSVGDEIIISIDSGPNQKITVLAGDIATNGAATAEEMQIVLSRIKGATVSIIEDQITNDRTINIRTDTPGARGGIEVFSSTIATEMGFILKKLKITDLPQRTVIYEINPRELVIELPAILPALRRTLKGSHHFHADATLEGPVAPANGIWAGSFFYSTTGVSYTVTGSNAIIQETLNSGQVYTKVTVDDASDIPNEPGYLIFNWGRDGEEQPVPYIGRPNNSTILLDPGYQFTKTQLNGSYINVLSSLNPALPRKNGDDLAIYLTSPSGARQLVQEILKKLVAAGVIIRFVILLPEYLYLCENPYE